MRQSVLLKDTIAERQFETLQLLDNCRQNRANDQKPLPDDHSCRGEGEAMGCEIS